MKINRLKLAITDGGGSPDDYFRFYETSVAIVVERETSSFARGALIGEGFTRDSSRHVRFDFSKLDSIFEFRVTRGDDSEYFAQCILRRFLDALGPTGHDALDIELNGEFADVSTLVGQLADLHPRVLWQCRVQRD